MASSCAESICGSSLRSHINFGTMYRLSSLASLAVRRTFTLWLNSAVVGLIQSLISATGLKNLGYHQTDSKNDLMASRRWRNTCRPVTLEAYVTSPCIKDLLTPNAAILIRSIISHSRLMLIMRSVVP